MTDKLNDGEIFARDYRANGKLIGGVALIAWPEGTMTPPGPARRTASGAILTGSSAGMVAGGRLSPGHSRWLMGYPAAWGSCGATAMRSCRRSRRNS